MANPDQAKATKELVDDAEAAADAAAAKAKKDAEDVARAAGKSDAEIAAAGEDAEDDAVSNFATNIFGKLDDVVELTETATEIGTEDGFAEDLKNADKADTGSGSDVGDRTPAPAPAPKAAPVKKPQQQQKGGGG